MCRLKFVAEILATLVCRSRSTSFHVMRLAVAAGAAEIKSLKVIRFSCNFLKKKFCSSFCLLNFLVSLWLRGMFCLLQRDGDISILGECHASLKILVLLCLGLTISSFNRVMGKSSPNSQHLLAPNWHIIHNMRQAILTFVIKFRLNSHADMLTLEVRDNWIVDIIVMWWTVWCHSSSSIWLNKFEEHYEFAGNCIITSRTFV